MNRETKAFIILLALGLFFIILATSLKNIFKNSGSTNPIGTIYSDLDNVTVYRKGYTKKQTANPSLPVYDFDTIETAENGTGRLVLDNGHSVKILSKSLIFVGVKITDGSLQVILQIKEGQLEIEQLGKPKELWIEKNSERVSAEQYKDSDLSKQPVKEESESKSATLSEDEIFKVVNQSKNLFFKCYTQLLTRSPLSKGSVQLSFMIEAKGKITQSKIQSSFTDDEQFADCLTEVLRRIQFKNFEGDPINAVFPLKFE
jgi:hypothetical protein